jgi:integrase
VVPLSLMARAIVNELIDVANRRAEELKKREGSVTAARFLLVSPAGDDQPIDGHALSVAMARFGKTFDPSYKDDPRELEHGKAAASWFDDRPTAHDLRRTLATRLAALGVPAEDVKACLNHARSDVTGRHTTGSAKSAVHSNYGLNTSSALSNVCRHRMSSHCAQVRGAEN